MKPCLNPSQRQESAWTYASLTVMDGQRKLKPTQAAFDRLLFAEPPRLRAAQVEIILRNGDAEQRHSALVLPHPPEATRIPIRLLPLM